MKLVTTRVPEELHRAVKVKCAELDLTMSQVIRRYLRAWVNDEWSPWDQIPSTSGQQLDTKGPE